MSLLSEHARRALTPIVVVVTFGMPIAVWCLSTGNIGAYFIRVVPPGQTLFVLSKLFALLAIMTCWFQIMGALAKDTPALAGFPRLTGRWHAYFGAATYAAVLTHIVLFIAASTIRTKHLAIDLLVPTFDHGFYRAMISLGAMGFWLLAAAMLAGWRRLRGVARYRWVHRVVFGVFVLAFVHGVTIGSETRFGLMTYVYAFIGLSFGTAVLSRAWVAVRGYRRRSLAVAAAGPVADNFNAHGK